MRLGVAAMVAIALGCSRPTAPVEAGAETVAPDPPAVNDTSVSRLGSRDEVPLAGPRVEARSGDWMLRGGGSVAVVSAARGTIVDFGADGGDDGLVAIDPTVFIGLDEMTSVVEAVEPAGAGGHALLVRRRVVSDPPMTLWTYTTIEDGTLRIESVATTGAEAALAVTLGEVVAWGNVPTWVEGLGFVKEKGSWAGDFIARSSMGVAYALALPQGHVVARFGKPLAGFHEWPRTGEVVEGIPAHGASRRRVVLLTQAKGSIGAAANALRRAPLDHFSLPTGVPPGAQVEVVRCEGSLPYARYDARGTDVSLPHGCWRARLVAPGYAPGAWTPVESLAKAPLPQAGTLRWRVHEKGGADLPARILVRGTGGTPDPSWGEDPVDGAALDVIHADGDDHVPIPPGRYHVTVSHGFEYTLYEADVTVAAGQSVELQAELDHVVDTRGWISADLHVHAVPSPDAPALLTDRVRSLAASGVEVAVATDHNVVTDYSLAIRERGLGRWLASIVGDEVTTRGVPLGHFNVFPLAPGSEPVPFDHIPPTALVASARAAPPSDRAKVVQLNHPRMGSIGYLELLHFDPRDVGAWRARSPLSETDFDAIEVFNGDHYADIPEVERVMRDWYALMDAGVHATATGNSDSHKLTYHECGVPRNMVLVGDDDPSRFDERAFVDAVRAGHVVVSSGVFVRIDVGGHGPGDTVGAGDQRVHVTVDAPPWVDVSKVEIVRRGETLHTWNGPFAHAVRRLDATVSAALAPGDWVIAIARGDGEMKFLPRAGAKPFGFTNAVWVK